MKEVLGKLVKLENLSEREAEEAMALIMEGKATSSQIAGFITALSIKGETVEEIAGCARAMREKAEGCRVRSKYCIDTCGTGGDSSNTFNISTAVAFVAAAAGAAVAKHGNRSVSSRSGSADVLEALGVNISLEPHQVARCVDEIGIGFLFAPVFHKSMKYAAEPRRDLGIKSIFNLLGPLTNPAHTKGQVMGVFDRKLVTPMAGVLRKLGVEKALVIHGEDKLDEISLSGATFVSEVKAGEITSYFINPEEFDIAPAPLREVVGGDAGENAEIIKKVFSGVKGPRRDIVVLNSAAALYVGNIAETMEEGIRLAQEIIDGKKAMKKLIEFAEFTNCIVA